MYNVNRYFGKNGEKTVKKKNYYASDERDERRKSIWRCRIR